MEDYKSTIQVKSVVLKLNLLGAIWRKMILWIMLSCELATMSWFPELENLRKSDIRILADWKKKSNPNFDKDICWIGQNNYAAMFLLFSNWEIITCMTI